MHTHTLGLIHLQGPLKGLSAVMVNSTHQMKDFEGAYSPSLSHELLFGWGCFERCFEWSWTGDCHLKSLKYKADFLEFGMKVFLICDVNHSNYKWACACIKLVLLFFFLQVLFNNEHFGMVDLLSLCIYGNYTTMCSKIKLCISICLKFKNIWMKKYLIHNIIVFYSHVHIFLYWILDDIMN